MRNIINDFIEYLKDSVYLENLKIDFITKIINPDYRGRSWEEAKKEIKNYIKDSDEEKTIIKLYKIFNVNKSYISYILRKWASDIRGKKVINKKEAINSILSEYYHNLDINSIIEKYKSNYKINYLSYYEFDRNYQKEYPLWSFQKEAVDKFMNIIEGKNRKNIDMFVLQLPTGTGKTRIANQIVYEFTKKYPSRGVIWIAYNWFLLFQAASNLARIYNIKDKEARIGNANHDGIKLLDNFDKYYLENKQVFYTTATTFMNKLNDNYKIPAILNKDRNPLVIIDECHHGIVGKCLERVVGYYRKRGGKSIILGLSATPKYNRKYKFETYYEKSFSDMSEYLAFPIVIDHETGFEWEPILMSSKLISPKSLEELNNKERNKEIIKELKKGKTDGRYNKTIIFTCSINHAENICKLCKENGFKSVVIHSKLDRGDILKRHKDFVEGDKDILVNVDMYTHGVDIPAIDSVFIVRPTMSEALMMQMIGRGARLTKDKEKFYIVEFRDTILGKNINFFHAKGFIENMRKEYSGSYKNKTRVGKIERLRYHSESENLPEFVKLNNETFEDINGITYVKDQTFGIEIEITSKSGVPEPDSDIWQKKAKKIIRVLKDNATYGVKERPGEYHSADYTKWSLEYDSSVGWEVVSPILKNQPGFEELKNVCLGLDKLVNEDDLLHINYKCGLHVHLGSNIDTDSKLKGFLKRVQRLEPGLFTLVSPSRLFHFERGRYDLNKYNEYCQPVRTIDVDNITLSEFKEEHENRYYTVNIISVPNSNNVLEIRMHNGTTDYKKIIPWISLWMYIFNHSRYEWRGEGNMKEIFMDKNENVEEENIIELLNNEGEYKGQSGEHVLFIDNKLLNLIKRRRNNLKERWQDILPEKVKKWTEAGWYETIDNDK